MSPRWTPDGQRVAFGRLANGVHSSSGSGPTPPRPPSRWSEAAICPLRRHPTDSTWPRFWTMPSGLSRSPSRRRRSTGCRIQRTANGGPNSHPTAVARLWVECDRPIRDLCPALAGPRSAGASLARGRLEPRLESQRARAVLHVPARCGGPMANVGRGRADEAAAHRNPPASVRLRLARAQDEMPTEGGGGG